MNDPTPPQVTPAAPTSPAPTDPTALSSPPGDTTTTPETALQIAEMLAAGTIDTTQAAKLAKAGGFTALQVAQSMHIMREAGESQPDARSPESIKLDEQFGAVAKPEEYVVNWFRPGKNGVMTAPLKEADSQARNCLVEMGFSRGNGNSLVNAIAKVAQETEHMTADELQTYRQSQLEHLQRAHGDKLQERLNLADDMIDQIEQHRPDLQEFRNALLETKDVGRNAMIWNVLMNHAVTYHARKGR